MDIIQIKEIPYYRCHEHKKKIDLIYLKPNSEQTLACSKCYKQNQLDLDYMIEIKELFQMDENSNQFVYNLPLKLTQEQYSILDNIMNEENENQFLIEQINSQFDSFKENVITSIEEHRNNILIHAQLVSQQRQKFIEYYNQLINKSEIKNKIAEFESYPNKLHEYLKNLALIKEKQQQSDKSKILNSLNNFNKVMEVFDFDQLKDQLLKILYQIESFSFIEYKQKNNIRDSRNNYHDQVIVNNNLCHAIFKNSDQENNNEKSKNNNFNNDNDIKNNPLLFQQYDLSSEDFDIKFIEEEEFNKIYKEIPYKQNGIKPLLKIFSIEQLTEIKNIQQYENLHFSIYDYWNWNEGNRNTFYDKLKNCTQAHSITFNLQFFNGQGFMKKLIKALKSCVQINKLKLHFYQSKIYDEEMREISEYIQSLENLTELELDFQACKLGSYGVKQIGIALKSCQKLTQLSLQLKYNHVSSDGIRYIAEGIQTCKELTSFYFDLINTKRFSVKAEQCLRNALSQCKKLQNNQFDNIQ